MPSAPHAAKEAGLERRLGQARRSAGADHPDEGWPHPARLHKPEHAVDLDTGAILAAPVHPGDAGDTQTLGDLEAAASNLEPLDLAPAPDAPAEVVADKGYRGREVIKRLDAGSWTTRIAEPARKSVLRWHGDDDARRAVYNNRARLLSAVARVALLLRAELGERAFAHVLDRGGTRRMWVRGRENVAKRYLVQVAACNLGLVMWALLGAGTPRAAADLRLVWLTDGNRLMLVLFVAASTGPAPLASITLTSDDPPLPTPRSHVRGQPRGQDFGSPACRNR